MNCSRLLVSRTGGRHRDTLWLRRVVGSPAHRSGSGGQNIELVPKGKRGDVFGPVFGHYDELEFLPYQNTSMCPRSADVGQAKARDAIGEVLKSVQGRTND